MSYRRCSEVGEEVIGTHSVSFCRTRLEYPEDIIDDIKNDPDIKCYYENDFVVCFETRLESLKKLLAEKVFELESGYENMASFNLDYCEVGFRCDNCTYERYEHMLEEDGEDEDEDAFF